MFCCLLGCWIWCLKLYVRLAVRCWIFVLDWLEKIEEEELREDCWRFHIKRSDFWVVDGVLALLYVFLVCKNCENLCLSNGLWGKMMNSTLDRSRVSLVRFWLKQKDLIVCLFNQGWNWKVASNVWSKVIRTMLNRKVWINVRLNLLNNFFF